MHRQRQDSSGCKGQCREDGQFIIGVPVPVHIRHDVKDMGGLELRQVCLQIPDT